MSSLLDSNDADHLETSHRKSNTRKINSSLIHIPKNSSRTSKRPIITSRRSIDFALSQFKVSPKVKKTLTGTPEFPFEHFLETHQEFLPLLNRKGLPDHPNISNMPVSNDFPICTSDVITTAKENHPNRTILAESSKKKSRNLPKLHTVYTFDLSPKLPKKDQTIKSIKKRNSTSIAKMLPKKNSRNVHENVNLHLDAHVPRDLLPPLIPSKSPLLAKKIQNYNRNGKRCLWKFSEKKNMRDSCIYCHRIKYLGNIKNPPEQSQQDSLTLSYHHQETAFHGNLFLPFALNVQDHIRFSAPKARMPSILGKFIECQYCKEPSHLGCILHLLNSLPAKYSINLPVSFPKSERLIERKTLHLLWPELDMVINHKEIYSNPDQVYQIMKDYFKRKITEADYDKFCTEWPLAICDLSSFQCFHCSDFPSFIKDSTLEPSISNKKSIDGILLLEKYKDMKICTRCYKLTEFGEWTIQEVRTHRSVIKRTSKKELSSWVCKSCLLCSFCDSNAAVGSNWTKTPEIHRQSTWHSILLEYPSNIVSPVSNKFFANTSNLDASEENVDVRCCIFPQLDILFCDECYIAYSNNNICPVCQNLFSEEDKTTPMMTCSSCDSWVHCACDPTLDLSRYNAAKRPNTVYCCPICRFSFLQRYIDELSGSIPLKEVQIKNDLIYDYSLDLDSKFSSMSIDDICSNPEAALQNHFNHVKPNIDKKVSLEFMKILNSITDDNSLKFYFSSLFADSESTSETLSGFPSKIFQYSEGNFYLVSIGDIPFQGFHNFFDGVDMVYPLNYTAIRFYPSYKNPGTRTLFMLHIAKCETFKNTSKCVISPKFYCIAADDLGNPLVTFYSHEMNSKLLDLYIENNAIFDDRLNICLSVPYLYGLRKPEIRRRIYMLPGLLSYLNIFRFSPVNLCSFEYYSITSDIELMKNYYDNSTETNFRKALFVSFRDQLEEECSRFLLPMYPRKCPTKHDPAWSIHYRTFALSTVHYSETVSYEDSFVAIFDTLKDIPQTDISQGTSEHGFSLASTENQLLQDSCGYDPKRHSLFANYYKDPVHRQYPITSVSLPPLSGFSSSILYNAHLSKLYCRHDKKRYKYNGYDLRYLAILRSGIQGYGVFALTMVPANTILIEYMGQVVAPAIAHDREKYVYDPNGLGTYFFTFQKSWIVDATLCGNAARYLNHSCEPNCDTTEITVDGKQLVLIISNRVIRPLEELTYDYRFPKELDEKDRISCHCGAAKCRGYMN